MKTVYLESPYAPANGRTVEEHVLYARRAMADSLRRGEAPLASHLLYTQEGILDDTKPEERRQGIYAGFEWLKYADLQVFYVDYGVSPGMTAAVERGKALGIPQELRSIGVNPDVDG